MLNPISFNESNVVVVDRKGEEGTTGDSEDTEPVALPLLNVYDGIRNFMMFMRCFSEMV